MDDTWIFGYESLIWRAGLPLDKDGPAKRHGCVGCRAQVFSGNIAISAGETR